MIFFFQFLTLSSSECPQYEWYDVSLTYENAVNFCSSKGGALATFCDQSEFLMVRFNDIELEKNSSSFLLNFWANTYTLVVTILLINVIFALNVVEKFIFPGVLVSLTTVRKMNIVWPFVIQELLIFLAMRPSLSSANLTVRQTLRPFQSTLQMFLDMRLV